MSVSQRVQILTDRSEEFLSLVKEFVNNPKLGEQLREEIEKLNSLTKEQEQKFISAHELLRNHEILSNDLQQREDDLAASRLAHDKEVRAFASSVNDKSEQLKKMKEDLDARASLLSESESMYAEARKKLLNDTSAVDRKHAEERAKLGADMVFVNKIDAANQEKSAYLLDLERSLKAKAAKLRELTAEM